MLMYVSPTGTDHGVAWRRVSFLRKCSIRCKNVALLVEAWKRVVGMCYVQTWIHALTPPAQGLGDEHPVFTE
jgi:hypothetical protein